MILRMMMMIIAVKSSQKRVDQNPQKAQGYL